MAINTLKGVEEIDGYGVNHWENGKGTTTEITDKSGFIFIDHDKNTIEFTIQNKPIKEAGINGCQIDTIIATAAIMLEKLNRNIPCEYNDKALTHLLRAYQLMEDRKMDREKRGVEGTSKK